MCCLANHAAAIVQEISLKKHRAVACSGRHRAVVECHLELDPDGDKSSA